jgi:hypothetical protein
VGSHPPLAAHQHQQRVDEQLGVDRHVRVEPVICLGARDGEGLENLTRTRRGGHDCPDHRLILLIDRARGTVMIANPTVLRVAANARWIRR